MFVAKLKWQLPLADSHRITFGAFASRSFLFIVAQLQIALLEYFGLVAIIIGPLIAFAFVVHFLERTIQIRLAERFGWGSVLWTGWLGTPVHELSHAAMCLIFRHRIDAISLFEPDLESGRLGYVKHSWRKGNWFEELGNLFIAVAPLIGGSAVLLTLLRLFYPAVFLLPSTDPLSTSSLPSTFLINAFKILFRVESILNFKFWVFVYLVLCVGSHMAPSRSDYRGATRGAVLFAIGIVLVVCLMAVAVPDSSKIHAAAIQILMPLFAALMVAVMLCTIATVVVSVVVSYFPQKYRVS